MSYIVRSKCECQATLSATLDEACCVIQGTSRRRGATENAPASAIGIDNERFDVAWACPFCGRHPMRSFDKAGLRPAA